VKAARLAEQLALPLTLAPDTAYDMLLTVTNERLELRSPHRRAPGPVYVDFVRGPLGYSRRVNRFGLLFQAVGLGTGTHTVIDATAGLGKDAFLLAYQGCHVTAVERSPILAALLQDGIDRARRNPQLHDLLGDRLTLVCADARDALKDVSPDGAPDAIYLDPMYPIRKKFALVKKEMRMVRRLVGDDQDAGEILEIARTVARRHVVVKRVRRLPPLAPDPTRTYTDRTARYDVYLAVNSE